MEGIQLDGKARLVFPRSKSEPFVVPVAYQISLLQTNQHCVSMTKTAARSMIPTLALAAAITAALGDRAGAVVPIIAGSLGGADWACVDVSTSSIT